MNQYIKEIRKIRHQGREIYGEAYLPKDKEKCPIVIFSHGYNGSYTHFVRSSEYLAANGVGAYCFDFCGGSANAKSSMATEEMTVFTEQEDLEAVIAAVKTWKEIDEENIFALGGSQGGFVTALTAEAHKEELRGILLLYPAFCIPDDWTKKYHSIDEIPEKVEMWGMTIGKKYIESVYEFDVAGHIGGYDKQVLIFHGDQDAIVPKEYSIEMSKEYPHAKTIIFPGEGHGFSQAGDQKVAELTLQFVRANS